MSKGELPSPNLSEKTGAELTAHSLVHLLFQLTNASDNTSTTIMASINPTSIPSITALRQDLNYGDAKLPRCQAFYEDVRLFRKKYISSQGLEGGSLHEWKLREHQNALGEMTRAFLDRDGNGRHYWPDDETSPRYNGLKYSSGHAR